MYLMINRFVLFLFFVFITPFAIAQGAAKTELPNNANYNVFLIPSDNVTDLLVNLDKSITKFGLNSLYSQGYIPHITLYLSHYPANSLFNIQEKVKEITSSIPPFEVEINSVERTKGNWLMLNIQNNVRLQALSDELVFNLYPLTAKLDTPPKWLENYPKKLSYFEKYNSPNVFNEFSPHITLLAKSEPTKLKKVYREIKNDFKATKTMAVGIGIAKDDENGQAKQIIASYLFDKAY